jgi:hypothetical protein
MFSESETSLISSLQEARSKIDLRLNSFVSRLTRRYPMRLGSPLSSADFPCAWNFCAEDSAHLEQHQQNNEDQWTGAGSG